MTERVDFYILGAVDDVAKLKYACRIVQKAYSQGMKVYLHTESREQSEQLDKLLWTFSQGSFIPHTIANHAPENWQHFPVQLGDSLHDIGGDIDGDIDDNGKGKGNNDRADLLICLTKDIPSAYGKFRRIVDLITDDAAEKSSGRARFRYYREQGIEPNTHIIKH